MLWWPVAAAAEAQTLQKVQEALAGRFVHHAVAYCGYEPTSVVDLNEDPPRVRRVGKGDVSLFEI